MVKRAEAKLILFVLLFLLRCAGQIPPGGGPVDVIPPQIVKTYPSNGTTNFRDDFIEITFSEYVDKRSVRDAIFISPPFKYPVEYDWSGKSLRIYFQDTLRENTTYTVTIGASVEDLTNHNKMVEPFSFAFSTGSKFYTGKISGKIYDRDPTNTLVFAYKLDAKMIDPSKQKPDFISQVGKNGKYTLVGLSNGKYNVLAIKEKLKDFLYQKNVDEIGIQFKEIMISEEVPEVNDVDFFISREDTIPPNISNVTMKDINHFLIEFSESIDITEVTAKNFYFIDSIQDKKYYPVYFFKGSSGQNQYYLTILDTFNFSDKFFLIAEKIIDKYGNKKEREELNFVLKKDRDTIAPSILKITGDYSSNKVDYDKPTLTLKFDDGINEDSLKAAVRICDVKENFYPFETIKTDDATFSIVIKSKLKQRTEYEMRIDLSRLKDVAGNKIDSVYKYKFQTISELELSGISGIVDVGDSLNIVIVLEGADENYIYKQNIDNQKRFSFSKVVPGKYLLWRFIDRDKDGKYAYGSVKPLQYAEEFKFYPDTLNLRARWPVGDIVIK